METEKILWITKGEETRRQDNNEVYRIVSQYEGIQIVEWETYIDLSIPTTLRDGTPTFTQVVTVYKPHRKYGEPWPAEINWSAMGSQLVELTQRFTLAMSVAIELADALNAGREG